MQLFWQNNIRGYRQKDSNDTEMRPCAEYYMVLEDNAGNTKRVWCDATYGIK